MVTGRPEDADPEHRQVIRIVDVGGDARRPRTVLHRSTRPPRAGCAAGAGDDPLPVTQRPWDLRGRAGLPAMRLGRRRRGEPIERGGGRPRQPRACRPRGHRPRAARAGRGPRPLLGHRATAYRLAAAPLTFGFGRDAAPGRPAARLAADRPAPTASPQVAAGGRRRRRRSRWLPEPGPAARRRASHAASSPSPTTAADALCASATGRSGAGRRSPAARRRPRRTPRGDLPGRQRRAQGNVGAEAIVHLSSPDHGRRPGRSWPPSATRCRPAAGSTPSRSSASSRSRRTPSAPDLPGRDRGRLRRGRPSSYPEVARRRPTFRWTG